MSAALVGDEPAVESVRGLLQDPPYNLAEAIIPPGTGLVLYSDGVSEAESDNVLFVLAPRDGDVFTPQALAAELVNTATKEIVHKIGFEVPGD